MRKLLILAAVVCLSACATHPALKMSGTWNLVVGDPPDSWPDQIAFHGAHGMVSTRHGVPNHSYYAVVDGEYLHLFLTKKELAYPKGTRIPFSYDFEGDTLKLMSPAGDAATYSQAP